MEKIIKIGETDVRLSNNVAWTMEYRDQFGKDIVPAIMPLIVTATEALAGIISDTGKTDNITAADIAGAIEGRAMDIMLPLAGVEFVDLFVDVTWAMAKAADETIPPPKRWVRQFDEFPVDVILPEVLGLVIKGFVSSKNRARLESAVESLRNLRPSLSTTSSSPVLKED